MPLNISAIERGRVRTGRLGSDPSDGHNGAFVIDSCEPGWRLILICSDGLEPEAHGWEHVSVRAAQRNRSRCPTWREMAFLKDRLWGAEDVVVQFHPRRSEYVNNHPHVLHLWRHVSIVFPAPPLDLVGTLDPTAGAEE